MFIIINISIGFLIDYLHMYFAMGMFPYNTKVLMTETEI